MITDLFSIKNLMIDCAELGAANYAKSVQPKSDDLTQNEAFDKFGKAWVLHHKQKDLIRGKRKGPAKNSPIYFSRAELTALRNAQKAERFGIFSDNKIE